MARKKSPEQGDTRAEIEAILEKLSEDSLRFLKQQAEILLYNSELAEARRKIAEVARDDEAGEAGSEESGASEGTEATPREPPVKITRRSETSFLITVTGTRVFFNRQEMRELTRIAHAAGDAADGARRLHRWLARERSDFLKDTGAARAGDPRLAELWSVIVSTYKAD
ncbi:MAG: hypothetical protein GVY29_09050 [Spirochaetes bacterium]|jgi:hypothetical protein|nr:hypothetical protein [Spirochaetota bacterium]